jgi:hypothetical protein
LATHDAFTRESEKRTKRERDREREREIGKAAIDYNGGGGGRVERWVGAVQVMTVERESTNLKKRGSATDAKNAS